MRFRGHPIHPMLVHFPIAFWSAAAACDLARLFHTDFRIVEAAYACIALGVVAGLVAAAAGFVEYAAVPGSDPAQGTLSAHMLVMLSAWMLYVISLVLRGVPSEGAAVPPIAIAVSLLGFAVLLTGAFLGGKLVYGFGVGVDAKVEADPDSLMIAPLMMETIARRPSGSDISTAPCSASPAARN